MNRVFNCSVSNMLLIPQPSEDNMTPKRSIIVSGTIAAIIALALITGAILSPGMLGTTSTTKSQTSTGALSVLLTDPPTVPNGVTALYATYNDIAVHVSNAGNQSGWYNVTASGTINLMSVINVSQTIATGNVPNGTYNALRFNITSAQVTYNGKNYTALFVEDSNGATSLTVPIVGGLSVQSGGNAAAVIDLTPTVLLLGNTSNPTFAFIGAARAYTMPAQSVSREDFHIGHRDDLKTEGWWLQLQHSAHFDITSASLSNNSLSITVKNTGNASLVFRMVGVTSTTSQTGGDRRSMSPDASIAATSAFFAVEPNESLVFINGSSRFGMLQTVAAGGYLLAPNSSATFTYSGPITIGVLTGLMSPHNHGDFQIAQSITQSIVSGQHYVITVQANGLMAQTSVVAS